MAARAAPPAPIRQIGAPVSDASVEGFADPGHVGVVADQAGRARGTTQLTASDAAQIRSTRREAADGLP